MREIDYIFAQVLGGVVGASLAYVGYINAIDLYEGGRDIRTQATAGLFAPFPVSDLSPETSRMPPVHSTYLRWNT